MAHYDIDHYLAPDIAAITREVADGRLATHSPLRLATPQGPTT